VVDLQPPSPTHATIKSNEQAPHSNPLAKTKNKLEDNVDELFEYVNKTMPDSNIGNENSDGYKIKEHITGTNPISGGIMQKSATSQMNTVKQEEEEGFNTKKATDRFSVFSPIKAANRRSSLSGRGGRGGRGSRCLSHLE
jgi:hypothetical protein